MNELEQVLWRHKRQPSAWWCENASDSSYVMWEGYKDLRNPQFVDWDVRPKGGPGVRWGGGEKWARSVACVLWVMQQRVQLRVVPNTSPSAVSEWLFPFAKLCEMCFISVFKLIYWLLIIRLL